MMTQFLTDGQKPAEDVPNQNEQENLKATIKALETALKSIKTQTDAALELLAALE